LYTHSTAFKPSTAKMSKQLIIPVKFEGEVKEFMNANSGIPNDDRESASGSDNGMEDEMGVDKNSKKIRKKRSAYQKIDDHIRVKLLEAV